MTHLLLLLVPSRCRPSPLIVTLRSSPLAVPLHALQPPSPCSCCCCRCRAVIAAAAAVQLLLLPLPCSCCCRCRAAAAAAAWLSFSQAWSHPHFVSLWFVLYYIVVSICIKIEFTHLHPMDYQPRLELLISFDIQNCNLHCVLK